MPYSLLMWSNVIKWNCYDPVSMTAKMKVIHLEVMKRQRLPVSSRSLESRVGRILPPHWSWKSRVGRILPPRGTNLAGILTMDFCLPQLWDSESCCIFNLCYLIKENPRECSALLQVVSWAYFYFLFFSFISEIIIQLRHSSHLPAPLPFFRVLAGSLMLV